MPSSFGQNFPQINAPFVDGKLQITSAWRQFLQNLWERTGGAQPSNIFVSGMVQLYGGPNIPEGWLICDGSAVQRAQYGALFNAILTTWGAGDGSTTFNLPNLSAKVALGASSSPGLGVSGGSDNVTLGTNNLPAHAHAITDPGHIHTITDPGHVHTDATPNPVLAATGAIAGGAAPGSTGSSVTGITIDSASTGITGTQNTGAGDPFAILPPFAALYYIIKT